MDAMILFLLLSFTFSIATAQPRYNNISLGSSLSPSNNSQWLSESGEFAFGFYPNGNGFAVGIWFAKTRQKTVTWTANRDDPPLSRDAILNFSTDGRLTLQPTQGQETPISNVNAASASMLNTGNFVLYNSDSKIIWQTFDVPTDTILPGQRLLAVKELVSSISETNQSSGKFQLIMQNDGNLVQYPVGYIGPDYAYWNTETSASGNNVSLSLDSNGQLYLLNDTGFSIKILSGSGNISGKVFYRAKIDADGIFRLYSLSLDQYGNWSMEWSSSSNRCDPKGLCGLNGYCTLMDQEPLCVCPSGFDFIDQGQKNLGCRRNFIADFCRSKNDTVYELNNVSWENNPYDVLSPVTKTTCRDECSKDCNCEVAVFINQECRKQKLPLRFGSRQLNDQVTTFVKVVTGGSGTTQGGQERKKELRVDILITSISFLALAFLILAISSVLVYRYRVWEYRKILNQVNGAFAEDVTLRSFTFDELTQATNGFMDEIGKGAFGTVFKGVISNGNRVVAIKRLEKVVAEGEREFRNEVIVIGRTHHKNLVRLLGYCHDGDNRLLVYEFMSKGSLADFLFKSEGKPTWEERIGIVLNIARGIFYLHEECERQIIHCDIKPENILMDENRSAKIADFGLAKLLMPYQTRTYTGMRGTRGYVAPEWHKNLPITVKADVYSFGIMLLEIICCRRSVDMDAPEDQVVLADWVYDCFHAHELDKLVQDEEVEKDKLERMVRVGLWCIQDEPSFRPSMKKVVLMLEGTVDIPVPPSPSSFLSSM